MLARYLRSFPATTALTVVKFLVIATLLCSVVFRDPSPASRFTTALIVLVGAILVVVQALVGKRYLWTAAFIAIGIFFSPGAAFITPSSDWFLLADVIAIGVLAFSVGSVSALPDAALA
jgi:hypothetical protein